ncbi:Cytochrome c oxidase assembly factor 6 [Komagataella phaffii CBS 7435]|uniref:Cytochrome c oxidase assembly factor 6 n=2 Tax=Komagataella phaffii TaxID=460519 RepID=C4QX79_KOMPG|nr:uncharacterized protein PAS_chr1-4_0018 [Komagataella phaffii GS115]AOA60791.1 GQ67_02171T0 [Komagataella phaffii]CAH2446658.1 Cytochrome c oxidase assembly factor 6 [Komagataella phaffii CBS 7435]AOA66356.1 GQ68_02186T0 [Komagataella phaffii GS115]CAY67852.1 Putative protein of unknown function [Komagataella phaffii GS115]CCA36933.1 Cytochrome c oxidase assembly factor 6 [Komagataella phaffii CBS 7435]
MALFSFSKQEEKAPTRSQRKLCWDARDEFFRCLDNIDVINSLDGRNKKTVTTECGTEEKFFEQNCAVSWVKYFKEKRVFDEKKAQLLKEAESQDATVIPLSGIRK